MTATLESLYTALDQLSYKAKLFAIEYLRDPNEDADLTDDEWWDAIQPELDRQTKLNEADPSRATPWEEVSARLKERYHRSRF